MIEKIEERLKKDIGENWVVSEPETVHSIIVSCRPETYDLIGAVKVLHSNNLFWTDPPTFEKMVLALNYETPIFGRTQDYPVSYLVYAMKEVNKHFPVLYNGDVLRYAAGQFVKQGLYYDKWDLGINQHIWDYVRNKDLVRKVVDTLKRFFSGGDESILTLNESIQLERIRKVEEYLEDKEKADPFVDL